MSFENPTSLRLGMTANFGGQEYRIVGRSVLGETEAGETYYWNEFNLETASGEAATLVFDETERTSEWRLFTQFDAEYPMTAADAAGKRVGDRLNLTGHDVRVTFRGSSCVYFVEGTAPEGEEVGTVAEYFNAEGGSVMEVVSWTGDEVEYYNGTNLSPGLVASAFNMPQGAGLGERSSAFSSFSGPDSGSSNYLGGLKFAIYAVLALFFIFIVFGRGCSLSSNYQMAPVVRLPASPRPLDVGASGALLNKNYHITGHAVVEIAQVGSNWVRHEYELTDNFGVKSLLACGEKPDDANWILYEPLSPMIAPTATEMAAKKVGDTVDLDGFNGKVDEILLSTIEQTDGFEQTDGYLTNGPQTGTISYGLHGANEYFTLLARWNAASIQYLRGHPIPAKKAAAAFTSSK